MKKLVASVLVLALAIAAAPINLIAAARFQSGAISGVASLSGKPIPNVTVRLRNVDTGQLVGNTTANAAGEFSFTGLPAGNFVVETVAPNGTILGTSAVALTAAAMVVTNLTVASSAAAVAAAGGSAAVMGGAAATGAAAGAAGLGTGVIVAIGVGSALAVTGIVVAMNDSSPSQ